MLRALTTATASALALAFLFGFPFIKLAFRFRHNGGKINAISSSSRESPLLASSAVAGSRPGADSSERGGLIGTGESSVLLGARGAPCGEPHPRDFTPASDPDLSFAPDRRGIKRELGEQRTTTELGDRYSEKVLRVGKLEPKIQNIEVISRNPAGPQELPVPIGPPVSFKPN